MGRLLPLYGQLLELGNVISTSQIAKQGASSWSVYPSFIPEGDQNLSQDRHEASRSRSVSPRKEGEDTRLRHDLARWQTLKKVAIAILCATRSQRQC